MIFALAGAHRVGKSSLAEAFAEKHGLQLIQTRVSKVWTDEGLQPGDSHPFRLRLEMQQKVMDAFVEDYEKIDIRRGAITDRSPIDMIAYTMGEAVGHTVDEDLQEPLARYVDRCFEVANRHLSGILLIQPGIPLVAAEGKGAFNVAWIEHLTHLVRGLGADSRLKTPFFTLQRSVTAMDRRVAAVESTMKSITAKAEKEMLDLLENRRKVH